MCINDAIICRLFTFNQLKYVLFFKGLISPSVSDDVVNTSTAQSQDSSLEFSCTTMIYRSHLLSYVLAVLWYFAFSSVHAQKFIDDAIHTIQQHARQLKTDDLCNSVNCCRLSDGACNLSSFPKDKTTLVYPGGESRCIFSTSTDYSFQIIPGDSDKVLLYFQGGGACWNKFSTSSTFCTTDAIPNDLVGVFDHSNNANPYKSYTVIHVNPIASVAQRHT